MGGELDHLLILLELKGSSGKLGSPFKFNPSWLREISFNVLVKATWTPLAHDQGHSIAHKFMENLKRTK